MDARQSYNQVFHLLEQHHQWFTNSLPLIASENIPSPAVREAVLSDFGNRYAEGWTGERVYAGCKYIDQVEQICIDLAKQLFKIDFADVRPISGVCANLVAYTTFTTPGDTMLALAIPAGGHISMGKKEFGGTAGAVRGLNVEYFPFDTDEMNIDIDATEKKVRKLTEEGKKPALAMFGGSVLPFPQPLQELAPVLQQEGAKVCFDAAHVAGLVAGGQFQDPLHEGADAMTCSTHKTLPGPQGGMILSKGENGEKIKKSTFPGNTSNHHLHHLAGKAIMFAEMLAFGKDYASQIVKNSRALAQALNERGFQVLGEKKGFTKSHLLIADITKFGDGKTIEKKLEDANIILNRNLLPYDIKAGRHFEAPGGIRAGVSEVTRLGMNEPEMEEIADLLTRVVVKGEEPRSVAKDVSEFRKDFQRVHYAFESTKDAYAYIRIR
ncbi:MAG TPA: serine hydroxymethyltransferase [Candidatus Dormibacteraeota bacterium]|jgi:glycine hydroxymethyltransferase|nr:serine hydroxymethyltransferase [Candidatus Dormibacteraeota bacterium]